MLDSIDPNTIPADAELIAGYVDGHISTWPANEITRAIIKICTWGPRHLGNCLDIENGDSIPSDIPDWTDQALERRANGDPQFVWNGKLLLPTLYCSLSDWALCRSYAADRPVNWWIAHYTHVPHIPGGADACQYGWEGGYDLSLCQPSFPR